MKHFLITLIALLAIVNLSLAEDTGGSSSGSGIELDFRQTSGQPTKLRTPSHIDLDVIYHSEINAIEVIYNGSANGEIFVYLGETIIGYDCDLNTVIYLPYTIGDYRIEIVTSSWIAQGNIQL